MDKSIIQLVDELPTDNITVKVLKALDYVAPSQWNNLVGLDNSIRNITGETDPNVIHIKQPFRKSKITNTLFITLVMVHPMMNG